MTIQEYFGDWAGIVDLQEANKIIKSLLVKKNLLCPNIKDVFRAFKLCPFSNLRVVVIGQDPYTDLYKGKPRATGLAFANSLNTPEQEYSPSLGILKESLIDYTVPHNTVIFDPSLEKWEAQGVLLLNAALSCEINNIGSHTLLWRPFMSNLLTNLSKHSTGIVYVLMGNIAQSFEPYINRQFNYIIKAKHPSWYARQKIRMPHDIWAEIDNLLIGLNGYSIKWFNN